MKLGTGNSWESCPPDGIFKPRWCRPPIYIHPCGTNSCESSVPCRDSFPFYYSVFLLVFRADAARNPSRRRGAVSRFSARSARSARSAPRRLRPPRDNDECCENGTRRVTAARFARFCRDGFYAPCSSTFLSSQPFLSSSCLLSSPRRRGKYHAPLGGVALLIPRYVTSLLFAVRRGEFLPRARLLESGINANGDTNNEMIGINRA